MTGAEPNTQWLDGCVALDDKGFVRTGPDLRASELGGGALAAARARRICSRPACPACSRSATCARQRQARRVRGGRRLDLRPVRPPRAARCRRVPAAGRRPLTPHSSSKGEPGNERKGRKNTAHGAAQNAHRPRRQGVAQDISGGLNLLLADVYALYLKTKNFHWHISGPHFRDYHLLLDEQADQIFAIDRSDRRARAQGRRHARSARSATSAGCSASWTTTPTT